MSDDIELLKAAGRTVGHELIEIDGVLMRKVAKGVGVAVYWNPLTSDGEALRLAVKLNFLVHYSPVFERCMYEESLSEQYDSDPSAATRRAIVRAAAALATA